MENLIPHSLDFTRRRWISTLAKSCLGVSFAAPWLKPFQYANAQSRENASKNAKHVIYLYMNGGMSHLDTFDVKPKAKTQGPVQAISTKVDGIQISEFFPNLAQKMDQVALIRSLSSTQGAHEQGNYFMHTSYTMRGTIQHPSLGPWILKQKSRVNPQLPSSIIVGGGSQHPGAGFLDPEFEPMSLSDPEAGLQNSKRSISLTESRFEKRLSLSQKLDATFHAKFQQRKVQAYSDVYRDALKLMKSEDLVAFDLNQEKAEVMEKYGKTKFGQGVLLARRLVEHGVRFVEVNLGGWDTHSDNFERVEENARELDLALSALMEDLQQRGLLQETLIVVATEFGRTPDVNVNQGRDHYPKAFSGLLAGGGIRGGQVYGKTDEEGREVIENRVTIPDFNATIAAALGLDLEQVTFSASNRPFKVADRGKAIASVLL